MSVLSPAPQEQSEGSDGATRRTGPSVLGVVRTYIALTKPRVIELLLATTVPAMFLARRGIPSLWLVLATLVGGAMAAGAANALNCVADADIDQVMNRTKARPLAKHTVPQRNALVFGLVLAAASFAVLWTSTNLLAALLALAAILFYVLIYTLVLKRRTAQNIVWGGAAGCMPVVIGWAAVSGRVGWPALVMFLIVFFWTPPHFWALAMKYREDYARAEVPMLPAVASARQVSARILAYSWVMVATTLLLLPAAGWLYLAVAVVSDAVFLVVAHRLHTAVRRGGQYNPMKLFHLSNSYLAALSVGIAVDAALGLPTFG